MTVIVASMRDVLKHPMFENMNEVELLQRENDEAVYSIMHHVGADKNKPVAIQACLHRDNVKKEVKVGYRYVFHERGDVEWLNSGKASLEANTLYGKKTLFQKELSFLNGAGERLTTDGCGACYKIIQHDGYPFTRKEKAECAAFQKEILALQEVQKMVRGPLSANEDVLWDTKSSEEVSNQDYQQLTQDYPEEKENE